MDRRCFLKTLGGVAAAISGGPSLGIPAFSAGSESRDKLVIAEETTFAQVVDVLRQRTKATVVISEADASLAKDYRFPPYIAGTAVPFTPTVGCLSFLSGRGWEGSRLSTEDRKRVDENYQLARAPFRPFPEKGMWLCNNPMWDWKWEKRKGGSAGTITIFRRTRDDGDIVAPTIVKVTKVHPDDVLGNILDVVKVQTGIHVEMYGDQFLRVPDEGNPKGEPRLEPMRVLPTVPSDMMERWGTGVSIGELLSALAYGLSVHTRSVGGDWKWSSEPWLSPPKASEKPAPPPVRYALRDFARLPK